MPFSRKNQFVKHTLPPKTINESKCQINFYKTTYSIAGNPLENPSLVRLFENVLGMHVSPDIPPSLKENGVVWYYWPECTNRKKLQPEIHLVNNISEPYDGKFVDNVNETTGKEEARRLSSGQWSAIADNHVAIFVDKPYFNRVLKELKDPNTSPKINFFGPVDRQDSGKPGGAYQLYIQIGNYPYVIELDTSDYDFTISPPLCRNKNSLEPKPCK